MLVWVLQVVTEQSHATASTHHHQASLERGSNLVVDASGDALHSTTTSETTKTG